LPTGVGIDPGGIGKGLAADLIASELVELGAVAALVNVGGDLRAIGQPLGGHPWSVSVENPFDRAIRVATITVQDAGVATTTPVHRLWKCDADAQDPTRHRLHVIDPRTGSPAETDVSSVTVIAAQAWMAEAVTKAVAVLGCDEGLELIESSLLAALIVTTDGHTRISSRMGAFLCSS
jgi:thiamine biosynthesis lipoprotein